MSIAAALSGSLVAEWPQATLKALQAARIVQLWTMPLVADESSAREHWEILSCDERQRARRFRFAKDRERFVLGRGMLRVLLGRYLSQDPGAVVFDYGPQGKPMISGTHLQFNLAHSGDIAVYAFCWVQTVGVDIEQRRPMPECEALAQRFFSAEERNELQSLPGSERQEAFFACWTRKEAYLKAAGMGLSLPLDSFRVSVSPHAQPQLYGAEGEWTLFDLQPPVGYCGAVAVGGRGWKLAPTLSAPSSFESIEIFRP